MSKDFRGAPKLHLDPCSSVGVRPRTDTHTHTHTHTHTQTRVTTIHFASSMTQAKCNNVQNVYHNVDIRLFAVNTNAFVYGCPSCRPTNSTKALKATLLHLYMEHLQLSQLLMLAMHWSCSNAAGLCQSSSGSVGNGSPSSGSREKSQ